jgi:hypothetical protein
MWKAKRKSRRKKNNKKIAEAEEFKQQREAYMKLRERFRQEFKEFCEQQEKEREERMRKWNDE